MNVTCKFCGKKIEKESAYCVRSNSGRNAYYCTENEYVDALAVRARKQKLLSDLSEVLGYDVSSQKYFFPMLKEVTDAFPVLKVADYVAENTVYLKDVLDRPFENGFMRTKYLMAVLKNQLIRYDPENQVKLASDFEILPIKWQKRPHRPTVEEMENAYLEEDDDVI